MLHPGQWACSPTPSFPLPCATPKPPAAVTPARRKPRTKNPCAASQPDSLQNPIRHDFYLITSCKDLILAVQTSNNVAQTSNPRHQPASPKWPLRDAINPFSRPAVTRLGFPLPLIPPRRLNPQPSLHRKIRRRILVDKTHNRITLETKF